jgi:hypothetical protein
VSGLIASKIPLKLGGLDSKQDSRWVVPGDLTVANNVLFDHWPKITKRNGYAPIATGAAGRSLGSFKNQLLLGTGAEAYGYDAASGSLIDSGVMESITVSARTVRRDAYNKTTPDAAVHPAGITVYTWDGLYSSGGYAVFNSATGQPIVQYGLLASGSAVSPKALVLGAYVVIVYYDNTLNQIRYIAIPAAAPTTVVGPTTFAADPFVATTHVFDATVINGSLFLTYLNSAGSNKISLRSLSSSLVLSGTTVPTTIDASHNCISIFGDASNRVWVAYGAGATAPPTLTSGVPSTTGGSLGTGTQYAVVTAYSGKGETLISNELSTAVTGPTASVAYTWTAVPGAVAYHVYTSGTSGSYVGYYLALGTTFTNIGGVQTNQAPPTVSAYYPVKAFVYDFALSTLLLSVTIVDIMPVFTRNITGIVPSGSTAVLLYESWASATYNAYINVSTLTLAGGVAAAVLVRSVGLASKPFYYLGRIHFLAAYQSALQSTYFLLSAPFPFPYTSTVVAKLAPSLGSGLTSLSILPEVNNPAAGIYSLAYLQADQVSSSGGNVFTQAGAMAATFDFTQPQTAIELSDDLHMSGGIMWMYDGSQVCEHGFHVYPENLVFTAGGAGAITGTYQACAVYEWMDAQGLTHQSAPSPVVSVTAASNAYFNYTVQSLRLSSRVTKVTVVFYRTLANSTVFYRTGSILAPIFNSTFLNSDITSAPLNGDTASDLTLGGNQQIYSNPDNIAAELPNIAAPATLHVWRFRNRVAFIPAENPFQWSFSKAYVPTVPIEFNNQQLYQGVAQDGGPLTCGIEMDEKNILFTGSRIYYVIGDGPTANGAGSDYGSAPYAIPSDVGCTNRRSLVLTPHGIMFQSAKGIYLLDRGLQVRYIGAPVEAFNNLTITRALLVPNSRRVLFFTSGGTALAYDYYADKWAVFLNQSAVDATTFGGLVTFVQANGAIMQETPGVFTDNGSPILRGLTTSWLSFAGLSGFQRVWRFEVVGDYISTHTLAVSVAFDGNPTPLQTQTVVAANVLQSPYEFVVKLIRQKCTSVQITIQESQPTPPYGEGSSLSAITFLCGGNKGLHPVGSTRSI